jgi:hypothetical protein
MVDVDWEKAIDVNRSVETTAAKRFFILAGAYPLRAEQDL